MLYKGRFRMGKIKQGLYRFMKGRYGTDKLNTVILFTGLIFCLLSLFFQGWANLFMTVISYVCLFTTLFRCLSRNTYKRYQENRKFLFTLERIKDREHKYFTCPNCRQSVRVPKGKGKISICCPKCRNKFIKKT